MIANYADIVYVCVICVFSPAVGATVCYNCQLYIINCQLSFLKPVLFLFGNIFLFVPFYFSGYIHDYTQYCK